MAETMSLDDFLTSQPTESVLPDLKFTLEPVEENPDVVLITPYLPVIGCRCELSFKLPKEVIALVEPTGETVPCCGKLLRVVRLRLIQGATLPASSVLEGITAMAIEQQMKSTPPVTPLTSLTTLTPQLAQLSEMLVTAGGEETQLTSLQLGDCQTWCNVLFPTLYLQVRAGIWTAKQAGVIKDRNQCYSLSNDTAELIRLLVPFNPLIALAIAAVSNECIKCACRKVF